MRKSSVDKFGLTKVINPNGRFLKNIILGLCMLILSFGGFACGNLVHRVNAKETITEVNKPTVSTMNGAIDLYTYTTSGSTLTYTFVKSYSKNQFDQALQKVHNEKYPKVAIFLKADGTTYQYNTTTTYSPAIYNNDGTYCIDNGESLRIEALGTGTATFKTGYKQYNLLASKYRLISSLIEVENGGSLVVKGNLNIGQRMVDEYSVKDTTNIGAMFLNKGSMTVYSGVKFNSTYNVVSSLVNDYTYTMIRNEGGSLEIDGASFDSVYSAREAGFIDSSGGYVKITSGSFTNALGSSAIAVYNGAELDITSGTFSGNTASTKTTLTEGTVCTEVNSGGVITAYDLTTSAFRNTVVAVNGGTFTNNKSTLRSASYGGVIAATKINLLAVTGGTFTNNYAYNSSTPEKSLGGAIYADRCNVEILNATLNGNYAYSGGAVYMANTRTNGTQYQLIVSNSVILNHNNSNINYGGVIATDDKGTWQLIIDLSVIGNNKALYGAVAYAPNTDVHVLGGTKLGYSSSSSSSASYANVGTNSGAFHLTGNSSFKVALTETINDTTYGSTTTPQFLYSQASNGSGGVVYTDSSTIANINIEAGNFSTNSASGNGGVIYNAGSGDVIITGGSFVSNHAQNGGVVYTDSANTVFAGATFASNYASGSGGLYYSASNSPKVYVLGGTKIGYRGSSSSSAYSNYAVNNGGNFFIRTLANSGSFTVDTTATVNGVKYGSSTAPIIAYSKTTGSSKNGGVAYINGVSTNINAGTFQNNISGNGGVLYLENGASLNVTGGTFTSNTASNGGAIYNKGTSNVVVSNASFTSNSASNHGGAIYSTASMTLGGAVFTSNSAQMGGAVGSSAVIKFSTTGNRTQFDSNTASFEGGALYFDNTGVLAVQHATLTGNSATTSGSAISSAGDVVLADTTITKHTGSRLICSPSTDPESVDADAINVYVLSGTVIGGSSANANSNLNSNDGLGCLIAVNSITVAQTASVGGTTYGSTQLSAPVISYNKSTGVLLSCSNFTMSEGSISNNTVDLTDASVFVSLLGCVIMIGENAQIAGGSISSNTVIPTDDTNINGVILFPNEEGSLTLDNNAIVNDLITLAGGHIEIGQNYTTKRTVTLYTGSPDTYYIGNNQPIVSFPSTSMVDTYSSYFKFKDDEYTMLADNTSLYLQEAVEVTFDPTADGQYPDATVNKATKKVGLGNEFGLLPTAYLSGKIFLGWFTAVSGGTAITATTTFDGSQTTYYAQYKDNEDAAFLIWHNGDPTTVQACDDFRQAVNRAKTMVRTTINGINAVTIYQQKDATVSGTAIFSGSYTFYYKKANETLSLTPAFSSNSVMINVSTANTKLIIGDENDDGSTFLQIDPNGTNPNASFITNSGTVEMYGTIKFNSFVQTGSNSYIVNKGTMEMGENFVLSTISSTTDSYSETINETMALFLTNSGTLNCRGTLDFGTSGTKNGSGLTGRVFLNTSTASINKLLASGYANEDKGAVINNDGNLTIHFVTLNNNQGTYNSSTGGAIYNSNFLRINGGSMNGNTAGIGGAIYISNGNTILQNVVFESNSSGAIYVYSDGSPTITLVADNCQFVSNTSNGDYGGAAIESYSIWAGHSDIYFVGGTTFENNKSTSGYDDVSGAVSIQNAVNLTIDKLAKVTLADGTVETFGSASASNVKFIGNSGVNGGAIWFTDEGDGKVNINYADFINNTANASMGGGAIYSMMPNGMTIKNSNFDQNTSTADAGAIYVECTSLVTITDCSFTGNKATNNGGAIYMSAGTCVIEECVFSSNSAVDGGAIYTGTGTVDEPNTITGGSFSGNTASGNGGAIYSVGIALIGGGVVVENNSAVNGGAIYNTGIMAVFYGSYLNNTATTGSGGAIYNTGSGIIASFVGDSYEKLVFSGNKATSGNGGAIYYSSTVAMTEGIVYASFLNNTAKDGAAVYLSSNVSSSTDDLLLFMSVDFDANSATASTGAIIYIASTSTTTNGVSLIDTQMTSNTGAYLINGTSSNNKVNFLNGTRIGGASNGNNTTNTLLKLNSFKSVYFGTNADYNDYSTEEPRIIYNTHKNCTIQTKVFKMESGLIYANSSNKEISIYIAPSATTDISEISGGSVMNNHGGVYVIEGSSSGIYSLHISGTAKVDRLGVICDNAGKSYGQIYIDSNYTPTTLMTLGILYGNIGYVLGNTAIVNFANSQVAEYYNYFTLDSTLQQTYTLVRQDNGLYLLDKSSKAYLLSSASTTTDGPFQTLKKKVPAGYSIEFVKSVPTGLSASNFIDDIGLGSTTDSGTALYGLIKYYIDDNEQTCYVLSDCSIYAPVDSSYLFYGFDGSIDFSNFNTSEVTNMTSMFQDCTGLTNLDVSKLNTSSLKFMGRMFKGCSALTSINVSNFDTTNVTIAIQLFRDCTSLEQVDLSNFVLSGRYDDLFGKCTSLKTIVLPQITGTSSITLPSAYTFYNADTHTAFGTTLSSANASTSTNVITIKAGYTITAHANGGTLASTTGWTISGENATSVVLWDETVELPSVSKTGYTFDGWYTLETGGTKLEYLETPTEDQDIYAHFSLVNYTLTYDVNGGSAVSNKTYDITTSTFSLASTSKSGYTFAGWKVTSIEGTAYSASGVQIKVGDTITQIYTGSYANITVQAQWTLITYTITYNLDGGSVSGNPTSYTVETATFTLKNPTKTGYTFAGWTGTNLSSASTSVTIAKGSTGNRTYTATWTLNTSKIVLGTLTNVDKVEYTSSLNGTYTQLTTSGFTANANQDYYFKATVSSESGYTITFTNFTGWFTDTSNPSGAHSFTDSGKTYTVNATASKTANTYTIAFNANNGSGTMSSITATYDQSITLPANTFTRVGYNFANWNTVANGSGSTYADKASVKNLATSGTVTLYAQWSEKSSNGVVVTANTLTYTGSAQNLVSVTNPNSLTIYYSLTSIADAQSKKSTTIPQGTNAGAYTVYYYVVETGDYKSSQGNVAVTISPKKITAPTAVSNLVYNGSVQTGVVASTGYTVTNNTGTKANTYTATATLTDKANTTWSDGTTKDKSISWTIAKKGLAITAYSTTWVSGDGRTYARTNYATGVNSETIALTYKPYTNTAGSYTYATSSASGKYTLTLSSDNYSVSSAGTFTLSASGVTIPTLSGSYTYNGSSQTATLENFNSTLMNISGNTQTNAGTHTITITLKDTTNYKWSDGTTTAKTISWTIAQKAVTYKADSASKTYDGTALTSQTATLSAGTLVSGHTASFGITGTITNVGSVTNTLNSVTIQDASGSDVTSNYAITKQNGTLTINAKTLALTWTNTSLTYTGSAQNPTIQAVSTGVTGETISFTYTVSGDNATNGQAINVGSYTVSATATVSGGQAKVSNYSLSPLSTAFTIGKATLSVPTNLKWSTTNRGTATWTASTAVTGITISYQVVLYKGSTSVSSQTTSSNSYNFASIIRQNGAGTYTFKVTAISSNTTNTANSAQSASSDNLYAVSIKVAKGTGISTATINSATSYVMINGESASLSATASTGYTFASWQSSSTSLTISSGSASLSASITSTSEITVTATATANKYTLTVNAMSNTAKNDTYANNATGGTVKIGTGTAGATATSSVDFNSTVTITATASANYTFAGWYLTSDLSGTAVSTESTITTSAMTTSGLTYYAKFTVNTVDVVVKHNPSESSIDCDSANTTVDYRVVSSNLVNSQETKTIKVKTGSTFVIKIGYQQGYEISSLVDNSVNNTSKISNGSYSLANLSANHTIVLTAKASSYTVSFDANGGTVNPSSQSVTYNSTYGTLPEPTYQGYTFNGWYMTNKFTQNLPAYQTGAYIGANGNITVYSEYSIYKLPVKANTTYTIVNSGKSNAPGYAIYNASGTVLDSQGFANTATVTFTTPANSSYILFSVVTQSGSDKYDKDTFTIYSTTDYVTSSTTVVNPDDHTLVASWAANALTFEDQNLNSGVYNTAYTSNAFNPALNGTGSYTYTIKTQPSGATATIDSASRTISLPKGTPAGTYKVVVTATDNGSKVTKDATMTIVIGKADGFVTVNSDKVSLVYPSTGTNTVKTNHGGTLSVSSSNANIASVTISGTTINITSGTTSGTATITVTSAETANYKSATCTFTVTVSSGGIAYSVNGYEGVYDGSSHGISLSVTTTGTTIKYGTTSGSYTLTTNPTYTNAGTYTVYYQISKTGYETVTGSATVKITKAPLTIKAEDKTMTYGGTAPTNSVKYTGFVNNETSTVLSGTLTYTVKNSAGTVVTVNASLSAGTYTITPSGLTSNNYEITFSNGTLTVERQKTATASVVDGLIYTGSAQTGISGTHVSWTGTQSATDAGSYTASATPQANYAWSDGSTGVKQFTWKISAKTLALTWTNTSLTYTGSAQNPTIQAVSTGVTGETISFTYTVSGDNATNGQAINVGSYTVSATATVSGGQAKVSNYSLSPLSTAFTIGKATLSAPTNLNVSVNGIVTWSSVTGATGYQISIDNTNWTTATSGIDYKSTITSQTGSRTVYVRAVSTSANYTTPSVASSKAVTVYSVSLVAGTGINTVTGNGNYISGASVSINATLKAGYSWSKWTEGSTQVSTTQNYTFTASKNVTYTANATAITYTITYNLDGGSVSGNPTSYTVETDTFTLKNPSKTGYTFAGWKVTSITGTAYSASGVQIKVGDTITQIYTGSYANITVQAQWNSAFKITLNVSFDDTCDDNSSVIVLIYDLKREVSYSYKFYKNERGTIEITGLDEGLYMISFVNITDHKTTLDSTGKIMGLEVMNDTHTSITWSVTVTQTECGGFHGSDNC